MSICFGIHEIKGNFHFWFFDFSWVSKTQSKKYIYQAIKQKEQSKIQTTRLSHEKKRHKWQDNMNLYENRRWNQALRNGKHFLLCMWHPSWRPLTKCARNLQFNLLRKHSKKHKISSDQEDRFSTQFLLKIIWGLKDKTKQLINKILIAKKQYKSSN